MNLIDDIDRLWQFWSTKLAILAGILGGAALLLPTLAPEQVALLPAWFVKGVQLTGILVTLGIIPARAIKQGPKE